MEELIKFLENTANMLRGMSLDQSIPAHAKEAIAAAYKELDAKVEELLAQEGLL